MAAMLAQMGLTSTPHTNGIYSDMTVDGPEIGTLVAVVDRAKNLPNRKTMGKQDPYCAARLGKEAKKTETDRRGGQTPRWDQELRFTVRDSPDYYQMKVSVFNDDKKTELIGETFIRLDEVIVPGGGQSDTWHGLLCKGKYAGEVRLELTYYDTRLPTERPVAEKRREHVPVKRRPLPTGPSPMPESPIVAAEIPPPSKNTRVFHTPPYQQQTLRPSRSTDSAHAQSGLPFSPDDYDVFHQPMQPDDLRDDPFAVPSALVPGSASVDPRMSMHQHRMSVSAYPPSANGSLALVKPIAVSPVSSHYDMRQSRMTNRSTPTRNFDSYNPRASPRNPNQSRDMDINGRDEHGNIVTPDGRKIDPSDHLPIDSWAPEPEPKGKDRDRKGPGRDRERLNGAREIGSRYADRSIRDAVAGSFGGGMENAPPTAGTRRLQKRNMQPLRERENFGGYGSSPGAYGPPIPAKVPMYDGMGGGEDMNALSEELKGIDIGAAPPSARGRWRRRG
ncbi:putative c2 domain containing protein [Diplodia seriata]|uniref:Putative c2 domain containing protein n=1 Tax=Diplodia seriata TaxID=420778 RepID=A0A0G2E7F5_9PEZI|nr:putative c2 domain containing protein [Diplodia seriata]